MRKLLLESKFWADTHGQDFVEYSLMAGFVATAAAAVMPGFASSASKIFSQVISVLAKNTGS